jgi:hypothetical protein
MIDRGVILERLAGEPQDESLRRISDWLRKDDTRLVSDHPARLSVSEALRLWTARLQNTDVTGQHLDGVEPLLVRLRSFRPQRKLEQFALVSSEAAGNLFFDGSTHDFVGAVIVKTTKQRGSRK